MKVSLALLSIILFASCDAPSPYEQRMQIESECSRIGTYYQLRAYREHIVSDSLRHQLSLRDSIIDAFPRPTYTHSSGIKLTTVNQTGGQTAVSITNNH